MDTDSEILEIPVVPRPASRASALLGALGAGSAVSFIVTAMHIHRPSDERSWLYFFTALLGAACFVAFYSLSRSTPTPMALRIEPNHIRLGTSVQGERAVAYGELWSAQKEGRGSREKIVFKSREEGGRLSIAVQTAFLPADQRADRILEAVRQRIAFLPDGPRRLDDIAARQAVAERISSGRNLLVLVLSALLILIFVAELATGALTDPSLLRTFGASSYPWVREGELFRLATANLLHENVTHLMINVAFLFGLGSFLAPLLGTGRFLTILMVSALVGTAGSTVLGGDAPVVGASAGLAGLAAAYAVILWRWPDRLSEPPARETWAFLLLIAVMVLVSMNHPIGPLAGFLAGLALMLPETHGADLLELAGRRRALFRGTAALLAVLFLVACGLALRQTSDLDREPSRILETDR